MKKLFSLLTILLSFNCFSQVKVIKEEFIDLAPEEKSCHASTIVELSKDTYMASWFAGEHENHPKVCIWISTKKDGTWNKPTKVADGIFEGTQYACWNPVLFKNSDGKLFLFYKVGINPREWWGMMKTSKNDGKTWSEAIKLPNDMLGPIKNKPIQLATGEILHPTSAESVKGNIWTAHLEISDANCQNWKKVAIDCGEYGVIQPSILIHNDGSLQMLLRSKQDKIIQTTSIDKGKSWGKLSPINLPNPNSGIDAVTMADGRFLLVYNPLIRGNKWSNGRNVLKLAQSKDGVNWEDIYEFENKEKGEFSYPAIIQASDGTVHVTYTYERKLIKYFAIQLN